MLSKCTKTENCHFQKTVIRVVYYHIDYLGIHSLERNIFCCHAHRKDAHVSRANKVIVRDPQYLSIALMRH